MGKALMTIGQVSIGAVLALWLAGCAGSQTRTIVATAEQTTAILEILGAQIPNCKAGEKPYFVGSQRAGQLVLAVGCK